MLDLAGNVWEYCADLCDEKYYAVSPSKNPAGPSAGARRVIRGGSWDNLERTIRSVKREFVSPGKRTSRHGFRAALGR